MGDATTYSHGAGDDEIAARMKAVAQQRIVLGHTHRPIGYSFDEIDLDVIFLREGKTRLHRDFRYIVSVGSVGQPRDGDSRAKYVIYDSETDEFDLSLMISRSRRIGSLNWVFRNTTHSASFLKWMVSTHDTEAD